MLNMSHPVTFWHVTRLHATVSHPARRARLTGRTSAKYRSQSTPKVGSGALARPSCGLWIPREVSERVCAHATCTAPWGAVTWRQKLQVRVGLADASSSLIANRGPRRGFPHQIFWVYEPP